MTTRKADDFQVRQERPFNGGPQLTHLVANFLTPEEQFFVRNHGDVPAIDSERHRLRISGEVARPLELSLEELARFPRVDVSATLQCAGNRRQELMDVRPIPGELPWGPEAIGNATWSGTALADVLDLARPTDQAAHVELIGLDQVERHGHRFAFGGSIPLGKAHGSEVVLAVQMNGRPLAEIHGAPLRAVVPGYIGARSVKWLSEIRLRATPSENYFQARAYRLFRPEVQAENVMWEEGIMLGDVTVSSIIASPRCGSSLPVGLVRVQGVAVAGSGRRIERVEVSTDQGTTWQPAELSDAAGRWTWRRWSAALDLPTGEHQIVARAWDSTGQTQPEHAASVWNFKGYMNTAWPRIHVRCG